MAHEYNKFADRRESYYKALNEIQNMGFSFYDHVHHNPAFAGHMNIARFLALYESYQRTRGLAGHIAEVGVWKASCLLYFAKLIKIFDPESPTLVHGFDWFKGSVWGSDEQTDRVQELQQASPSSAEVSELRTDEEADSMYRSVKDLIAIQNLENIVHLHRLDVTKELEGFFGEHPHIRFRIVFLDVPTYEATKASVKYFWPRLTPGGVMIFDTFNHEITPGETRAICELLPDLPVHDYGFTNQPSSFIVKPSVPSGPLRSE